MSNGIGASSRDSVLESKNLCFFFLLDFLGDKIKNDKESECRSKWKGSINRIW